MAVSALNDALTCSQGLDRATRTPVLLVHGTGTTADNNWSWTYLPALDRLGIPWCQVDLPEHGNGDIQTNAEYVVHAIRAMHTRAGRPISIIGHSQGGMLPRWALKFWPETRSMVDDLISFAASNHGTTMANCTTEEPCNPATWQQSDESNFIRALNADAETWNGVSYTNIYTHTDEVVQPNSDDSGSSSLHTGEGQVTNVATQDVCPTDVNEHLLIGLIDPVAYALALDALIHSGPAVPRRIPWTVCLQLLQPGINPLTGLGSGVAALLDFATYQTPTVPAEPPLRCYVTATCGRSPGAGES